MKKETGKETHPPQKKSNNNNNNNFSSTKRSFTCSEAESAKHQQHALLLDLHHCIDQ